MFGHFKLKMWFETPRFGGGIFHVCNHSMHMHRMCLWGLCSHVLIATCAQPNSTTTLLLFSPMFPPNSLSCFAVVSPPAVALHCVLVTGEICGFLHPRLTCFAHVKVLKLPDYSQHSRRSLFRCYYAKQITNFPCESFSSYLEPWSCSSKRRWAGWIKDRSVATALVNMYIGACENAEPQQTHQP